MLLVGTLAFSSERDHPHVVIPIPPIPTTIRIQHNQVAPITDNSRYIVSPPQSLEMDVRKDSGLVNSFFSVSTEVIAPHHLGDSTPSSMGISRQDVLPDSAVAISINSPIERRGALVPQPLTEEGVKLLMNYGTALSKQVYCPSEVSDSAFKNIMGVPTVKELLTTKKGLLGLLSRGVLLYVSYDFSDISQGWLEVSLFKKIFGLVNYYPYQAIQNANIADLAATGPLYLFMFPGLITSYGAQCYDGCERIVSFVKRRKEKSNELYNTKNAWIITSSSVALAIGSGITALPKSYSLFELLQQTGTWGDSAIYFSYAYYFASNFYTLYDSSTTYIHSKIHNHLNKDDPTTASYRSTLLSITQNAITRWMDLPDQEKTERYNQLFAPDGGDMDAKRLYQRLFFLFDFGRETEPVRRQEEPKIRRALGWFSEGLSAVVGPLSFRVIQTSVKSQLDSFGCFEESTTSGLGYCAASVGSVFTTMLSRCVVRNSLTQVYDAWTGYKNVDDVSSSLYANSSSGYASHRKLRSCLTTYNKINGSLLGITMGKSVFDALPFPDWVRYPSAVVAAITSGSMEALFLQRWTHKLVNVVDKNVLQKVRCMQSLSDPEGVVSDEFIEYVRNIRLWITKAPDSVVQELCKLAVTPGLRGKLMESFN